MLVLVRGAELRSARGLFVRERPHHSLFTGRRDTSSTSRVGASGRQSHTHHNVKEVGLKFLCKFY
jgi:hypothetical protein